MATVKELQAQLKAAKAEEATTKRASKRSKLPLAKHTDSISMSRRPESFGGKSPWGVDHAFLTFHDAEGTKLVGRLDPEDTLGQEYRERINTYAKENRVGNSKIRFDGKLGCWKGLAVMFPPEMRTACEYVIKTS